MLSSPKKRSDKSSGVVPAWHPNFRNSERLPDTKAVRTSFFINALAVFVAGAVALYMGYREYELHVVESDIAVVLADVQANKPASDKAVALYGKFQEEEKKVLELKTFLSTSRLVVSDFILLVGESLPPAITLGSIDYRSAAVVLRGSIEGAPDEASGRAVAYVEGLKKNDAFDQLFDSIKLTNIVRDPGTGRMQFVIDLKFKAPLQTPAGKKK